MSAFKYPKITASILNDNDIPIPEYHYFLKNLDSFANKPAVKRSRAMAKKQIKENPILGHPKYSEYRIYKKTNSRSEYEKINRNIYSGLSAILLDYLFERTEEKLTIIQDVIWRYCEETCWILPAHEINGIDLRATDMGMFLSEIITLLKEDLDCEVYSRVEFEIRRRLIDPYMNNIGKFPKRLSVRKNADIFTLYTDPDRYPGGYHFYGNNWNGKCNSSMGITFLYLEKNKKVLARALNSIVDGLLVYFEKGFEKDGASNEGVGYWHYGMTSFIMFAEMLFDKTDGKINLFDHPLMKKIAGYPLAMCLSKGVNYSLSDSTPFVLFEKGNLIRLGERTGEESIYSLVNQMEYLILRFNAGLRDILWDRDDLKSNLDVSSCCLPEAGIFKIVSGQIVVAGKAGHNAEYHNHNDVGSFVVHSRGEDFLCDLGVPIYTGEYFTDKRYKKFIHAMSSGHSVPIVNGKDQLPGEKYKGKILDFQSEGKDKQVVLSFPKAYGEKSLKQLTREIFVSGNSFKLTDKAVFNEAGKEFQECFITRMKTKLVKNCVQILGKKGVLTLKLQQPENIKFKLEEIEVHEQNGSSIVTRILIDLGRKREQEFVLTGELKRR